MVVERAIAVIAALLAACCIGAWAMHGYMAPRIEAAELRAETIGGQLREQNRAVAALRDAGEVRAREAAARLAEATAAARQSERHAQWLMGLALPQGVDECTAARALIAKELGK